MKKLITAIFTSTEQADNAVNSLKSIGFSEDDMSVISPDSNTVYIGGLYGSATSENITDGLSSSAGNVATGVNNAFVGLGEISYPPALSYFTAYEPVTKTLTGLGVPLDVSKKLEKEVKNNKALLYIEVSENDIDNVMSCLSDNGAEKTDIH